VAMRRNDVAAVIAKRVVSIGYSHFKDSIKSEKRHDWYFETWDAAYNAQRLMQRRP